MHNLIFNFSFSASSRSTGSSISASSGSAASMGVDSSSEQRNIRQASSTSPKENLESPSVVKAGMFTVEALKIKQKDQVTFKKGSREFKKGPLATALLSIILKSLKLPRFFWLCFVDFGEKCFQVKWV